MNERKGLPEAIFQDWQRRLSTLLVGLFLLQFVRWIDAEGTIWLSETVLIVKWTLFLVGLLELLPRLRPAYRVPLQFAVLLLFTCLAVGYRPVWSGAESLPQLAGLLIRNATQLYPYFWFTIGTWLAYLYMNWFVLRKWRIVLMLGISVLFFAIRDSFSLLQLWSETALVVFCGLSLLVVRHFADLKKRNPVGWAHLAEYPASAAVPIVLLLTIVMVLGIVAPAIPPTLTDPYSLFMAWRGQPVPSFGKGLGSTGLGGTGNASSGYSRSDANLGGGFDFNYDPVMTVDTTHRAYWRGETRSVYDGSGWEASGADKQAGSAVAAASDLANDPRLEGDKLKTVEVKQTVTMLKTDETFPVLFGAYSIKRLESVDGDLGAFERLTWSGRQAELRFQEKGKAAFPKTYTVVSEMPVIDEAGLRTASPQVPAGFDEYLQLPGTLPARVKELAERVTATGTNPYDKVKLLEQYLQITYPYANKPDTSLGKSKDFVDRFLFEIKEGYCDYYSTALAVMTRAIGIPSRWVKGYSTGQTPTDDIEAEIGAQQGIPEDPDGAGIYTVRNSDAHSWVEVYFSGWGWVPFEPTSGFTMPTAVAPADPVTVPDVPAVTLPADDRTANKGFWTPRVIGTLAVAVAAILAAAAVVWLGGRRGWLAMLRREPSGETLNQRVVADYNRLLRFSRRRGYSSFAHETARETLGRWMKRNAWLSRDYLAVISLFEKAKYSGRVITPGEAEQMASLVKKLREEL